jgi:hypothetical protein
MLIENPGNWSKNCLNIQLRHSHLISILRDKLASSYLSISHKLRHVMPVLRKPFSPILSINVLKRVCVSSPYNVYRWM